MNYEHLDLFSGIGGFALAAKWAGWQTVAFSEIDPYACKILAQNFPGVPNLGDIRSVRGIRADLITGGFPCQPYSLAGKRRGAKDDRALWPEMRRIIADARPRWVLGENVPGIINMELDRVLADLENLGYTAWPIVLPACAVDAKHRRDRVWIVGHDDSQRRDGQRVPICARRQDQAHAETDRTSAALADATTRGRRTGKSDNDARQPDSARSGEDVADTNGARPQRRHGEIMRERTGERTPWPGDAFSDADRESTRRPPESRQEHCEWQPEPGMGRVAHGIPNRVDRLKGLGNAIVPQIAARLMREMICMENAPHEPPVPKPDDGAR